MEIWGQINLYNKSKVDIILRQSIIISESCNCWETMFKKCFIDKNESGNWSCLGAVTRQETKTESSSLKEKINKKEKKKHKSCWKCKKKKRPKNHGCEQTEPRWEDRIKIHTFIDMEQVQHSAFGLQVQQTDEERGQPCNSTVDSTCTQVFWWTFSFQVYLTSVELCL